MPVISFQEFGKLRLHDFYPHGTKLERENSGFECHLGSSGFEGFTTTYFAWPEDQPDNVGEISLDFKYKDELPFEIGQKILDKLGLPLRPEMKESEIVGALGAAINIDRSVPTLSTLHFQCGGESASVYRVECNVDLEAGLLGVGIVREDLHEEAPSD